MKTRLLTIAFLALTSATYGQKKQQQQAAKPKLVVGIVIDQMRWDYLYRFYDLFSPTGGFRRLLDQGYSCDNAYIPYTPSVTAVGHSCIYTGSVPAINGITGNNWFDNQMQRSVYCTDDSAVTTVGSASINGRMSPKNLLTTTITDQLRLSSNFQSKVIGISMKDRGAILPAGHAANGAFWYDGTVGKFITSSYYMNELPQWVNNVNSRQLPDSLYQLKWKLSLPDSLYKKYCSADEKPYEVKPFGADQAHFPYSIDKFAKKDYTKILTTPYGNQLLLEMVKSALVGEHLGKGAATDFLAVSFSSPDYIGHAFGPNSWENLDDYIKLDKMLGELFAYLDAQVGKKQYLVFLSADHGVAHVPGFLKEHKLPGGNVSELAIMSDLNTSLKQKYNVANLVTSTFNYQVHLNHRLIDSANINLADLYNTIISQLTANPAVTRAFALTSLYTVPLNSKQREMFANGYYPPRSGEVQFVLKPGYIDGGTEGTTHGLWNPYDTHIPLLWYGWHIQPGKLKREVYMYDIAPTIAALLNIQAPNGAVGKVIEEVIGK